MPKHRYPGFFVAFEGGEGAGKSTLLEKVAQTFEARSVPVTRTRQPGGTPLGQRLRTVLLEPTAPGEAPEPLAELFLYAADRVQNVERVIVPGLREGHLVLCDRYGDSSVVYQGEARGVDDHLVEGLNGVATGGLRPDLTVVVDVPAAVGLERAKKRGPKDRFEQEELAFHERIRKGFRKLAKGKKDYLLLDGTKSPELLAEKIIAAIETIRASNKAAPKRKSARKTAKKKK